MGRGGEQGLHNRAEGCEQTGAAKRPTALLRQEYIHTHTQRDTPTPPLSLRVPLLGSGFKLCPSLPCRARSALCCPAGGSLVGGLSSHVVFGAGFCFHLGYGYRALFPIWIWGTSTMPACMTRLSCRQAHLLHLHHLIQNNIINSF